MLRTFIVTAATVLMVGVMQICAEAQTTSVRVLARQYVSSDYEGQLNGSVSGRSTGQANCNGVGGWTNCAASGQSDATIVPPRVTYDQAQGANLILQAPDGRIAIVYCVSKYAMHGDGINVRSCRIPPQNEFTVEFNGQNAKLRWAVGWDQKKTESETYRISQVLSAADWETGAREWARGRGYQIN
jgi:hypothetical protein